jgi:hypothetical protein
MLQVAAMLQVFAVEQGEELGVRQVVLPGEFGQPANGLGGRHVGQVQLLLGGTDVGVGGFEHGEEELVLAGEVVVDQALVQAGALGHAVHARTGQPVLRKLVARGQQDDLLRAVGIACACFLRGGFGFRHG